MSKHAITLDINGFGVEITSSCDVEESFEKIRNDFCSYTLDTSTKIKLRLVVYDFQIDPSVIQNLKFKKIFSSCETVQKGDIRYNRYDESTHVRFDYAQELAEVYAPHSADQHELCYLIILSRLGKSFDLDGCHRIHAFAGNYQNKAFAISLDMGQGKSTMAFELLRQEKIKLISDDAPYFDREGNLCPFLMRLGIGHKPHLEELERKGYRTYLAERRNYLDKHLLALSQINQSLIQKTRSRDFILMFGRRGQGKRVSYKQCSKLRSFFLLVKPMVIGVGLPILSEYFWEFGPKDFYIKTRIAISRIMRAIALATSKRCYWFEFGDSLEDNLEAVIEVLER